MSAEPISPSILGYLDTLKRYHTNSAPTGKLNEITQSDHNSLTTSIRRINAQIDILPESLGIYNAKKLDRSVERKIQIYADTNLRITSSALYLHVPPMGDEAKYFMFVSDLVKDRPNDDRVFAISVTSEDFNLDWIYRRSDFFYLPEENLYEEVFGFGQGWGDGARSNPLTIRGQIICDTVLLIFEEALNTIKAAPYTFRRFFED